MNSLENLAVGLGMDSHRLVPGGPLVLGGVTIPFDQRLLGHSDGDCLVHAVLDAVLSAADEPDLGTLFPNTAEVNRGRSSLEMAREVGARLARGGARVLSIDAVVICEAPRMAPHREAMRAAMAAALGLRPSQVGVKGKTAEGLGPMGRGEGIEARAVALVLRGGR